MNQTRHIAAYTTARDTAPTSIDTGPPSCAPTAAEMATLRRMLPGWLALAALTCGCLAAFQATDAAVLVCSLLGVGFGFLAGVAIGGVRHEGDPTCPACGMMRRQWVRRPVVCDHCEVCKDGAMVIDYEEDHHRSRRLCGFGRRLRNADRAYGRWTTKKALALLDDGNVDHARRTLAHAMRLAQPPEVG
jgi:hypothetical protein